MMRKPIRSLAIGLAWALAIASPLLAAGIYSGMPPVAAVGGATPTLPLTGSELYAVDTGLANGQNPQTETITVSQARLFVPAISALTDGVTIAVDASLSDFYSVTLAGNRTLSNPTNLVAGKTFRVAVTQDATGSRTLAYGTLYKWPAGSTPTLSTTSQRVDLLTFVYDGTRIMGSSSLNYQ